MPKCKRIFDILNRMHPVAPAGANWFSVVSNAADSEPAEILIYAQIGKTWYDEDGVAAKDFNDALKAIPATKNILVRINSKGGNVWDGLAIYHMLCARGDKVTCRVEGLAASISSVIAMAGKCEMPANALMMIHEPSALLDHYVSANAEEMREMADEMRQTADMLDKHGEAIAGVYAAKSGKPVAEMREKMRAETWMTGSEAKDMGLCQSVTSAVALAASVKDFDLSGFRRVPDALAQGQQKPSAAHRGEANPRNIMDRNQIIALLKEHGHQVSNDISDADLQAKLKEVLKAKATPPAPAPAPAAPAPTNELVDIRAELATARKERDAEKRARITAKVTELQPNRFAIGDIESHVNDCVRDEDNGAARLARLEKMPVNLPGAEPINGGSLELTGEGIKDIEKHILANSQNLTAKFIGNNAGRAIGPREAQDIRNGAVAVHNTITKHRKMLMDVLNTNTIDSGLKRQLILNGTLLREFEVPMLALRQFSTVFSEVPLQGTDKVEVPYMGLQGINETKSFAGTYTFTGNGSVGVREITVGGDGDAATCGENATAGTVKDRLYQDISFTSYEQNRIPFLNIDKIFGMKGERLALDLFKAIVRRCIVTGNNYAVALTRAAAAFNSDDLASLWEVATGANWPGSGRQVTLPHQYNTSLIKDPAFKAVYAAGNDEALRRAEIKKAYGFDDINIVPNLDTYMAANAAGWIAHMSALLVATATIIPTEEVRALLTRFEVVQNPQTGISFAYRRWGNAEGDASREIVEVSVGAAKGLESAMQIIKKQ